MRHPAARTLAATAVASVTLAAAGPALADAHGLVGRTDLPIPRWLFAWAAAAVLVVSFVALATLWPKPRLETATGPAPGRTLLTLPARAGEVLCAAFGMGVFLVTVYAGFAGTQDAPTANLAPTVIYVVFWIGIPILSLVLGDVFRAFSPWRTAARLLQHAEARVRGADSTPAAPRAYPERLGYWPAAAGILVFAWVELIYTGRDDPSQLATMAVAYAVVQVVGMRRYGIDAWTERADAFGVVFAFYGRIGPLFLEAGRLATRPWLSALPAIKAVPGTVGLLCVMIGTTSYDGFSLGATWRDLAPDLTDVFESAGLDFPQAYEVAQTIGMVVVVLLVAGLYRLGVEGMKSVGGTPRTDDLAGRFAHSLIPISLAYVVAHYISLLLFQGQAIWFLASDPLGDGTDLFGTADHRIDYFISATGIWYLQVGALVLGHAAGLVLAHDRALVLYRRPRDATRSQYWMLAVMVGFTSLGLWLLSAQGE
ncbi:hypothetical protein DSM112329_03519 [Paraconexibacter sp. AEG42_29]|uniref:Fenitrothion hydrolase n=1 Tax=Paraconexibacter sp. AEG42_29 TaxID=2997339 RepID=A0AAU7AYE2_9ACTN